MLFSRGVTVQWLQSAVLKLIMDQFLINCGMVGKGDRVSVVTLGPKP